jgi:hypothetical protein
MVLKLIQSGGFTGRTKLAEEDLSAYPPSLEKEVELLFAAVQAEGDVLQANATRDQLHYFVEYNNRRLPVSLINPSSVLSNIIERLKKQLHY